MKIAYLIILFSLPSFAWCIDRVDAEPFTVAVVPSRSSLQRRTIDIADDNPNDFYVVLTNRSDAAQPVFESWNSWGYQTISFEFTTAAGKKIIASKRSQDFSRNVPSTFLIPSGEIQVYSIRFDRTWEIRPTLAEDGETKVALKAIYEVSPTPEAKKANVWLGRVESKTYDLTLRHWRASKSIAEADIRITFALQDEAPAEGLPTEARNAGVGHDAQGPKDGITKIEFGEVKDPSNHGPLSKLVKGKISEIKVNWADPAVFKKDEKAVANFLRQSLADSKGSSYTFQVWSQGLQVPMLTADVEHVAGKSGKLFIWKSGDSGVQCVYRDSVGTWWFSSWTNADFGRNK